MLAGEIVLERGIMFLKLIFIVILCVLSAYAGTVFTEDTDLWTEIDRINAVLEDAGTVDSDTLEELFGQTIDIVSSQGFSQQFEDLRADAFESDDFGECDEYVERAGDAVNVYILGESNNIGVNTTAFLDRAIPESEAYVFFLVAVGGFYIDGEMNRIGTAELPAWMERAGSSAQAVIDPIHAEEWLSYWLTIRPSLDGYFLTIADETILGLGGGLPE